MNCAFIFAGFLLLVCLAHEELNLPLSCTEIFNAAGGNPARAPDGPYIIGPDRLSIHCEGMEEGIFSRPRGYLVLKNTDHDKNCAEFVSQDMRVMKTCYTALRVEYSTPSSCTAQNPCDRCLDGSDLCLKVNLDDRTHSISVNSPNQVPRTRNPASGRSLESAPYGIAADCTNDYTANAKANIDLRGTGTRVMPGTEFIVRGVNTDGEAVNTDDHGQAWDLSAGGWCGSIQAAQTRRPFHSGRLGWTLQLLTVDESVINPTEAPSAAPTGAPSAAPSAAPSPAPIVNAGACCDTLGQGCEEVEEALCQTKGAAATFLGVGTTCAQDCLGACCFTDGSGCLTAPEAYCTALGAVTRGKGSSCATSDICAYKGCCQSSGLCVALEGGITAAQCTTSLNGVLLNPGQECVQTPGSSTCPSGITSAPTSAPSSAPSAPPTGTPAPTSAPSAAPSSSPTGAPSPPSTSCDPLTSGDAPGALQATPFGSAFPQVVDFHSTCQQTWFADGTNLQTLYRVTSRPGVTASLSFASLTGAPFTLTELRSLPVPAASKLDLWVGVGSTVASPECFVSEIAGQGLLEFVPAFSPSLAPTTATTTGCLAGSWRGAVLVGAKLYLMAEKAVAGAASGQYYVFSHTPGGATVHEFTTPIDAGAVLAPPVPNRDADKQVPTIFSAAGLLWYMRCTGPACRLFSYAPGSAVERLRATITADIGQPVVQKGTRLVYVDTGLLKSVTLAAGTAVLAAPVTAHATFTVCYLFADQPLASEVLVFLNDAANGCEPFLWTGSTMGGATAMGNYVAGAASSGPPTFPAGDTGRSVALLSNNVLVFPCVLAGPVDRLCGYYHAALPVGITSRVVAPIPGNVAPPQNVGLDMQLSTFHSTVPMLFTAGAPITPVNAFDQLFRIYLQTNGQVTAQQIVGGTIASYNDPKQITVSNQNVFFVSGTNTSPATVSTVNYL